MFAPTLPAARPARGHRMANLGAMLPRPARHSGGYAAPAARAGAPPRSGKPPTTSGKPPAAPGGRRHQATGSLQSAFAARGGVVRELDGFEVFYGVSEGDKKAAADERDGFEVFFGIGNGAPGDSAASGKGSQKAAMEAQQLEAQLQAKLGGLERAQAADGEGAAGGGRPPAARPPRRTAPPAVAADAGGSRDSTGVEGKAKGVEVFSLATPAPSFAPPSNVPTYSLATPASSFAPPPPPPCAGGA